MIEKTVMDYLEAKLAVPVSLEVPESPSGKYIVIQKTGGGQRGHEMRSAVMAVQTFGDTLYDAAELNEQVLNCMEEMQYTSSTVISCILNSSYNFTDLETKRYRYQAVFDLVYFV